MQPSSPPDTEHALVLRARRHAVLPAEALYNAAGLARLGDVPAKSQVFVIGTLPNIEITRFDTKDNRFVVHFRVGTENVEVTYEMDAQWTLKESDGNVYFEAPGGQRFVPQADYLLAGLHVQHPVLFEVLYVGQGFGANGARDVIGTLVKQQLLQRILAEGLPKERQLQLLLLDVQPEGKAFGTSEEERAALFEAAFVRYFQPRINATFPGSASSTNPRALRSCRQKDFGAVVAEIAFDDLTFDLCSPAVKPARQQSVTVDLRTAAERDGFFTG